MECCNTNMNMTLIIKTPREMLEQRFPDKYPWEAISGKKEFNYSQNKKQIEEKKCLMLNTCSLYFVQSEF